MADTDVDTSGDVQTRAREMGWIPEEEFHGDKSRWVDAETYVERGETVMPILQATNKKLREEQAALRKQIEDLAAKQAQAEENVKALNDSAAEMAKLQYNRALANLKSQKAEALREGDHDAVVEVDEAIADLKAKGVPEAKPAARSADPTNQIVDTKSVYFAEWAQEEGVKEWLNVDTRKTAMAAAITTELAQKEGLKGRALLDRVKEEMAEAFAASSRRAFGGDKMEGSRGGAGTPSGRAGGKTWDALPQEAKDAANRQEARLVGPGKIHKDRASWRASFTRQYFGE
jgi:hypothetical protein